MLLNWCVCVFVCVCHVSVLYSPNLTHQTCISYTSKIVHVVHTMTKSFSFILQKMSGTPHFLTKRHHTSTFPHSTESWARTSPSCLKPLHPPASSWKTWASKTLFGLNSAVSKISQVRRLIPTALRCEYNLSMKDYPRELKVSSGLNSAGGDKPFMELHLSPSRKEIKERNALFQQTPSVIFPPVGIQWSVFASRRCSAFPL